MQRNILMALAVATVLAGCSGATPRHLQYDFGRAFTDSFIAHADLTRPSAANLDLPLTGLEAQAIRLRVSESACDGESGESTVD